MRFALEDRYDVALTFSRDQDLTEVARDVRGDSVLQDRRIPCACAFPVGPAVAKIRGIHGTDWIRIDRPIYDACIDPTDYRVKTDSP